MRIRNIKKVGKLPVYDISVADVEHYVLSNGVITHNTGVYLSADSIYIIGRQQEKEGTDISGYNFIINVDKSRHVREKSKIPIGVSFADGISRWSGLLEMALESGKVIKPSNGWYSRVDVDGVVESRKWRAKETNCSEFWSPLLSDPGFTGWVSANYQVTNGSLLDNTESLPEIEE